MRRTISLLGVLFLVTGCATGSGTASKAPTDQPVATVAPTTAPTTAATPKPTPTVVSARLAFDGTTCTYTGPTVVTAPATLVLTYAPTDEAYALNVGSVVSTATFSDVKAGDDPSFGPAPGKKVPTWLLGTSWHAYMGTGTSTYDLRIVNNGGLTYDQFTIACVKHPWTDDQPVDTVEGRVAATLIKLVPAT